MLDGIPRTHRQFRFITGDPAKETVFRKETEKNEAVDPNAARYPSLFAFHGSACKNWHSILREGLHFSKTTNGRAYGKSLCLMSGVMPEYGIRAWCLLCSSRRHLAGQLRCPYQRFLEEQRISCYENRRALRDCQRAFQIH